MTKVGPSNPVDAAYRELFRAAHGKSRDRVVAVMSRVALDPNHRMDFDAGTRALPGGTALHLACEGATDPLLPQALLDRGADPNVGDAEGWTALHHLLGWNQARALPEVCQLLLERRADPNRADRLAQTPVFRLDRFYEHSRARDVIVHLVDHGARLDHRDHADHTVLDYVRWRYELPGRRPSPVKLLRLLKWMRALAAPAAPSFDAWLDDELSRKTSHTRRGNHVDR